MKDFLHEVITAKTRRARYAWWHVSCATFGVFTGQLIVGCLIITYGQPSKTPLLDIACLIFCGVMILTSFHAMLTFRPGKYHLPVPEDFRNLPLATKHATMVMLREGGPAKLAVARLDSSCVLSYFSSYYPLQEIQDVDESEAWRGADANVAERVKVFQIQGHLNLDGERIPTDAECRAALFAAAPGVKKFAELPPDVVNEPTLRAFVKAEDVNGVAIKGKDAP